MTKTLIAGLVTGLLVGSVIGQAQIGDPWEKVETLKAEKKSIAGTYLQYKETCFVLKDQLENTTTTLLSYQAKVAETNAEHDALLQSYRDLEEEYEDLEAKHLDFIKVYKLKYFTFSNLTIAPTVIQLGENVTISFFITNVLGEPQDFGITTNINGMNLMDSITVSGYETKKISYVETPEVVGNFTVTVGGLTGSFMVTQEG
ncbi:MAG: hypothetical protein JRJ78_15275 [Deltaproteobacteria bacterium]|nr:hypothetical protein [Deltaproteobacteria bacterium]